MNARFAARLAHPLHHKRFPMGRMASLAVALALLGALAGCGKDSKCLAVLSARWNRRTGNHHSIEQIESRWDTCWSVVLYWLPDWDRMNKRKPCLNAVWKSCVPCMSRARWLKP